MVSRHLKSDQLNYLNLLFACVFTLMGYLICGLSECNGYLEGRLNYQLPYVYISPKKENFNQTSFPGQIIDIKYKWIKE